MNPIHGEPSFKRTRLISPFISPADIVSGMEVTQKELEKAMKEIDKKLALPEAKFEKYASDLLERAVKGLRRSR